MQYQPLSNRVLVKELPRKEKTEGGLYIPETAAKELLIEGVAVAIGNGKKGEEMSVKEGDKVIYPSSAGGEISVNGEVHILISEDDIWAIKRN